MKFSSIDVLKTKENTFYIEWNVYVDASSNVEATTTLAPASVDDYNFKIYWSLDPVKSFSAIRVGGSDVVIDGAVGPLEYTYDYDQYDFNQLYYFKVKAIHKSLPIEFFSDIVYIGKSKNGIHEVMRFNEETLYSHYTGEPCYIIKRKSTGTRCGNCWSEARQQRIKSVCSVCNGTGFNIGYYQPISVQIAFDSDPKVSDLQKTGENVFDDQRARLSNYPIVRPKDIIINRDDFKRYLIVRVDPTKLPNLSKDKYVLSKQNYIISQILVLNELNSSDNEYQIDIDALFPVVTTVAPTTVTPTTMAPTTISPTTIAPSTTLGP